MPDELVHRWVRRLPSKNDVVVVSLLGQKPDGTSEFSLYSFYKKGRSFRHWLDENYKREAIQIIEHPTCDMKCVPDETVAAVGSDLSRLLLARKPVVLMDSGGWKRVEQVCRQIGAVEDSSA